MAPGRRSQGPPPPPPPTPPRQSKRPRVQTARAAANAAATSSRGKGKGDAVVGRPPPSPLAPAEPLVDKDEAEDLPPLPAMPARSVGITASLKRKKDMLQQIEDRRTGKTKATTYDPRGAAAKEGLFGPAARGALGDAARRREYEADERKKEARLRVEIRREEEQSLWAERVKKYGEEEAHRRLREEREAQKELDLLPTSELDELRLEEEHGDPKIEMKVGLRVNKRIEWAHTFVVQLLSEFDIWTFEELFNAELDKRNVGLGWVTQSIMVIVKSKHSKAVQVYQSIDDFSEPQWSKVVDVIKAQSAEFYPDLTVRIEIAAVVDKDLVEVRKKARNDLTSDPLDEESTSKARLTRTDRLLEQTRSRAANLEDAGKIEKKLTTHWQCHDKRCTNKDDYCFIDYIDKHYSIEAPKQARWAKAIANQEPNVTIYRPPRSLYLLWTDQNDEVTLAARYSRSKQKRDEEREQQDDFGSTMKEYMTFQKQMTSIQLQKNMGESMSSLTHKEPTSVVQQQPLYQQQPVYQPQSMYQPHPTMFYQPNPTPPLPYQQQQMWGGYQGPYGQPSQQALPQSMIPQQSALSAASIFAQSTVKPKKKRRRTAAASPSVARKSSPIDSLVDDSVLITEFFKWLAKKTPKERHHRLTEVYSVVLDQEWTIDDLKQMADPSSTPYRVAIQKGIPDGAARRFKTDIAQFGPHYRAAKALLAVAEGASNTDGTDGGNTADEEEDAEDEDEV